VNTGKPTRKSRISGPVVVTGHTGFKGAWLTELLRSLSLEVAGYSLEPLPNALYSKLNHQGKFQEEFADVRDIEKLTKFVSETKPKVIFHLAAQPLVLESYLQPIDTFGTNVMGTANLLHAAFACDSVEVVVVVTTDKVYENKDKIVRFTEQAPLGGKDPYSASKVGAEQAVVAWRQIQSISGGPRVVAVRAGNVIGGGDISADRLLPDLIRAFQSGVSTEIRNPLSTRPWQHVVDPLAGYILTAEHLLGGNDVHALNFSGVQSSETVFNVVEAAISAWGGNARDFVAIKANSESRAESRNLDLDSGMARDLLGWKPHYTQIQAVEKTIDWHRVVENRTLKPSEACERDLREWIKQLSSG
jgi:CDP-glucose 4,6-dehydratase